MWGCAYFHDLLKPASILCKELQADEVCIVQAIEAVLKTAKNLDKVKATVKVVLLHIEHEGDCFTYQGADM